MSDRAWWNEARVGDRLIPRPRLDAGDSVVVLSKERRCPGDKFPLFGISLHGKFTEVHPDNFKGIASAKSDIEVYD